MCDERRLSDEQFLAAFLDCTLPAAVFDHRAHVRVAWLFCNRHGLNEAIEQVCYGIARYAAHLGATQKFHRTLSEALTRIIAKEAAQSKTWDEFVAANPLLMSNARQLLARYYSPELLESDSARDHFIAPDRLPL